MKTEQLHRHVCSITGKGMSEGFLFQMDVYIKEESDALEYAKSIGYNSLEESYEDEMHYWTTWEDNQDLEWEGEAYDDDGNLWEFVDGEWRKPFDLEDTV